MATPRWFAVLVTFWVTSTQALREVQKFPVSHVSLFLATPRGPSHAPGRPQLTAVNSMVNPMYGDGHFDGADPNSGGGQGGLATEQEQSAAEESEEAMIIEAFTQLIAQTSLTTYQFHGNFDLTQSGWKSLLQPLTQVNAKLEEFSMQDCDLQDEDAEAIGQQLPNLPPSLKRLWLDNSDLSPDEWTSLFKALASYSSEVEEIGLGWCALDSKKMEVIATELRDLPARVKVLKFDSNPNMPETAWAAVLSVVSMYGMKLGHLDLRACELQAESGLVVRDVLMNAQSLEVLKVAGNNKLSEDGWKAFLSPLTRATDSLGGLVDVNFNWCDLDDWQAEAIGRSLNQMPSKVMRLNFARNEMVSPDAWATLLEPMASKECNLVDINFGDCQLDDDKCNTISTQLMNVSPKLQKVNFRGNKGLSARGWFDLLSPIANPECRLRAINFENCNLDDDRARAIGYQLSRLPPSVKTLDFAGKNLLSAEEWVAKLESRIMGASASGADGSDVFSSPGRPSNDPRSDPAPAEAIDADFYYEEPGVDSYYEDSGGDAYYEDSGVDSYYEDSGGVPPTDAPSQDWNTVPQKVPPSQPVPTEPPPQQASGLPYPDPQRRGLSSDQDRMARPQQPFQDVLSGHQQRRTEPQQSIRDPQPTAFSDDQQVKPDSRTAPSQGPRWTGVSDDQQRRTGPQQPVPDPQRTGFSPFQDQRRTGLANDLQRRAGSSPNIRDDPRETRPSTNQQFSDRQLRTEELRNGQRQNIFEDPRVVRPSNGQQRTVPLSDQERRTQDLRNGQRQNIFEDPRVARPSNGQQRTVPLSDQERRTQRLRDEQRPTNTFELRAQQMRNMQRQNIFEDQQRTGPLEDPNWRPSWATRPEWPEPGLGQPSWQTDFEPLTSFFGNQPVMSGPRTAIYWPPVHADFQRSPPVYDQQKKRPWEVRKDGVPLRDDPESSWSWPGASQQSQSTRWRGELPDDQSAPDVKWDGLSDASRRGWG